MKLVLHGVAALLGIYGLVLVFATQSAFAVVLGLLLIAAATAILVTLHRSGRSADGTP